MNDRAPIRDRTIVLRILVPRLADRLREKMKELEDVVASQKGAGGSSPTPASKSSGHKSNHGGNSSSGSGGADSIWDLEGVSCEPTAARNKTLWNFHCDGAAYPAKLVNLPCPVELHKTVDHATYYKTTDVCQMLIVYEDDHALQEADEKAVDGFPSYYHSGLTPPMHRVVEGRFAAREHKAVAPPRSAVADVEDEIMQLMERLQKEEKGSGGNKRNKLPTLASTTKVLEEVEEVVVDYEPWMDDGGKQPDGVEFDIEEAISHPELFLTPAEIREIKEQHEQQVKEEQRKKAEAQEKKQKKQQKRNKKQQQAEEKKAAAAAAAAAAAESKPVIKKKGIASKKHSAAASTPTEEVDEIEQAAKAALSAEDMLGDMDNFFDDFNLEEDAGFEFSNVS